MNQVPITEARTHLPELVDDARLRDCHTMVTRHTRPVAVIVSWDWYVLHKGCEVTGAQQSGSLSPITGHE